MPKIQKLVPQVVRRGETSAPTATFKLMDIMGASRASRALGVSTTTLQTARKAKEVSKVIEVAAEGLLRDLVAAGPINVPVVIATKVFLLEVREDQAPAVAMFAKKLNATLVLA